MLPAGNYRDKYRHLIGDDTVSKDDAKETVANRSYGFVSADNKRDRRTIEQVLADTRAKKRQRTDVGPDSQSGGAGCSQTNTDTEHDPQTEVSSTT
nr:hypothetical protein BaRGS_032833 [Batillaria attramentaria]